MAAKWDYRFNAFKHLRGDVEHVHAQVVVSDCWSAELDTVVKTYVYACYMVSSLLENVDGMGADVPTMACDENSHLSW